MNTRTQARSAWRPKAGVAFLLPGCLLLLAACGRGEPAALPDFQFTRLDAAGKPYEGSGDYAAEPWPCVHDRRTGLYWEVKSPRPGLHHRDNTYTWYDPDRGRNGGDPGVAGGGECSGSACDTQAYVKAVNEAGLCGFHDWRLPVYVEIASINDPRVPPPGPTIEHAYFPGTHAAEYWTGVSFRFYPAGAWAWGYEHGLDRVDWKKEAKYVRLVRGELRAPAE